jgi:hypothetical protein
MISSTVLSSFFVKPIPYWVRFWKISYCGHVSRHTRYDGGVRSKHGILAGETGGAAIEDEK